MCIALHVVANWCCTGVIGWFTDVMATAQARPDIEPGAGMPRRAPLASGQIAQKPIVPTV